MNQGDPKLPPPEWQPLARNLKKGGDKPASPFLLPEPLFFNRDVSWMHFNDRVLAEAAATDVPPLERLRFLSIVSSNLDEFFMVRVAELARWAKQAAAHTWTSAESPRRIVSQLRDHVIRQKTDQAMVFRRLLRDLGKNGIRIHTEFRHPSKWDALIRRQWPPIKCLIRRSSDPLPPLMSDQIHIFIRFPSDYAIVAIEDRSARLVQLGSTQRKMTFGLLERWLSANAPRLFPQQPVLEAFPFKLIRDADLRYHPDDEETLEEQIVEAVHRRLRARVVRLEVDSPYYSEGTLFLASQLGLDSNALYRFDLPLDLRTLAKIYNAPGFERLKYPPVRPQTPAVIDNAPSLFDAIRERDVLLHHPYDSFDVIERFLLAAAQDPHVTRIYHTIYRTSKESPILEALKEAVRHGKKVYAYVEIKARFDELNNVRWAEELRKSGVKVMRPLGNFKVHCKVTQIFRQEEGEEVSYLHLGTGNYHAGTAKQYTDLGLLTRDRVLGADVATYFQMVARHQTTGSYTDIIAAPLNLHQGFIDMVKEETRIQKGGGRGHIIAKMNSLVDEDMIKALYDASLAGVKVELIVRGICCLKPGVKGLSENIRVVSIVDRFLEHSRIFYFRSGGAKKIFLSSADWMPRNFYSRYELAFPIKDPALKKFLRDVVLANALADNTKAWNLKRDGSYERVPRHKKAKPIRSQALFEQLARAGYKNTVLKQRGISKPNA